MVLRKVRVEFWDGIKVLVLRDATLPRTYDEFVALLCLKIPQIEVAAQSYVLRLDYHEHSDVRGAILLQEDDDLLVMYEAGESLVLNVQLEEVTDRTRHLLVTPEFIAYYQHVILPSLQQPPLAPNADPAPPPPTLLNTPSLGPVSVGPRRHSIPVAQQQVTDTSEPLSRFGSLSRSGSTRAPSNTSSNAGSAHFVPFQALTPTAITPSSSFASGAAHDSAVSDCQSDMTGVSSVDSISVPTLGATHTFQLAWTTPSKQTISHVMGALGTVEWEAQRGWGYKQVRYAETDLTISYAPRESSLKNARMGTRYTFTIIFSSRPLFDTALHKYPRKLASLTPSDFLSAFIAPLATVVLGPGGAVQMDTEWAVLSPPAGRKQGQGAGGNPRGGGEYHCCYAVKETGREAETVTKRVEAWVRAALGEKGCWGPAGV
ncbi:hypothetical protein M427DRAFT_59587 [Gonapodya prolifera JEL478]|uniref:Uncharacterized protein n=1 Tax=Gonapodya prolifera (strain JEL478) TaxID=1344416 RepID=A0A139A6K5_GONPJ|nr:hypothetical protein M427DRAFT_59587 [Gonapodya prolifera JEL478]|eukprot:KXS12446.1 hypothetical protein M427DRAFT_59587 [Gonapodya prolifera JEL478]